METPTILTHWSCVSRYVKVQVQTRPQNRTVVMGTTLQEACTFTLRLRRHIYAFMASQDPRCVPAGLESFTRSGVCRVVWNPSHDPVCAGWSGILAPSLKFLDRCQNSSGPRRARILSSLTKLTHKIGQVLLYIISYRVLL